MGKAASEAAVSSGINVLTDTLRGKNVKESLKTNMKTTRRKVANAIESGYNEQLESLKTGKRGRKRKNEKTFKIAVGKKTVKKKKRKKEADVFDDD